GARLGGEHVTPLQPHLEDGERGAMRDLVVHRRGNIEPMPFEHSKKRIAGEVAVLVGIPALLALGAWAAFGAMVDAAARHVPVEAERALGDGMAKLVRQGGHPCAAPEVEAMARRLAAEAGLDAEHLDVAVLDD